MDINYKQDQFELFPGRAEGSTAPQPAPRFIFSSMTLSAENIIVLTVFIFLGIIVSFSVGVEKGKRLYFVHSNKTIESIAVMQPVAPAPLMQKDAVGKSDAAIVAKKEILTPVPRVEAVAPKSEESFYTVQVASFKLRKFAEDEAQGLKGKGYETFIVPKGKHLVVCAGRFLDQGAAKIFSGKFKSKYKDCLVRRL
jgi:hypothetical protein